MKPRIRKRSCPCKCDYQYWAVQYKKNGLWIEDEYKTYVEALRSLS